MAYTQSAASLQYIRVPVVATFQGNPYNPTADTVQMAFIASTASTQTPGAGDWKAAVWETAGSAYYANCLVGPGGTVTLAVGTYTCWVKISDNPEVPVIAAGQVVIY